MVVLDASAVLALLFREPGHVQVAAHLGDSCLSAVNLAEVIGRFVRDGHSATDAWQHVASLPIEIVSFTPAQAVVAAALSPRTRPLGLSIADRACLALAITRDLPALTADRAWAELDVGASVVVIR